MYMYTYYFEYFDGQRVNTYMILQGIATMNVGTFYVGSIYYTSRQSLFHPVR